MPGTGYTAGYTGGGSPAPSPSPGGGGFTLDPNLMELLRSFGGFGGGMGTGGGTSGTGQPGAYTFRRHVRTYLSLE